MQAIVVGAGIAGLCCALELLDQGVEVQVLERGPAAGVQGCSWCAGGMLAPWCELEEAGEPLIARLGEQSLSWWRARTFQTTLSCAGTLVVAAARDLPELTRFAQRTHGYRWLAAEEIAQLEPDLAGRFARALYFEGEAHLDPRCVLPALAEQLIARGGSVRYGVAMDEAQIGPSGASGASGASDRADRWLIDCRGLGARRALPDLRGVRGEMLLLRSQELRLRRPVRLLHPRTPAYLIPREDGVYMLGATMIESDDAGPVSARSMLELLGAAYVLHPALGEARVLESCAQVRPAFPDNLPQIRRTGRTLHVNGLYRHGFLLAPALAMRLAQMLLHADCLPEPLHEHPIERCLA